MTIANARPSRGVEIAWPRPVDFRLSNGIVQYRVRGTTAWINLFSLVDLGGVNDQVVLASLQEHGFTIDEDGKLHLTALEQAVVAEVADRIQDVAEEENRARAAEVAEAGARIAASVAARLISRAEVMEMVSALAAPPLAMPRIAYSATDGRAVKQARLKVWDISTISQSLGIRGTSGNAFSTTPLPENRAVMPSTGLRRSDVRSPSFIGLQEGFVTPHDAIVNESMEYGFASHFMQIMDSIAGPPGPLTPIISTAICGMGGKNWFEIKDGSAVYNWYVNHLTDLAEYYYPRGYEVTVPAVKYAQVENDVFYTNGFDEMLRHYQEAVATAANKVLGQTIEPTIYFYQGNRVVGTQATAGQRVQADQLQAAFVNPKLCCVGPIYGYEMGDVVHKSSRGAYGMGMLFARGIAGRMFGQGRYVGPGRPLMPRRAPGGAYDVFFINPTQIRINVHVPVEPLVIDTSEAIIKIAGSTVTYDGTTWTSPGMQSTLGFNVYSPTGAKLAIQSVSIFSATTTTSDPPGLLITLATAPTVPYVRVSYAENRDNGDDGSPDGPQQGARGCVCDSANHVAIYDGALDRNRMVMWSQRVPTFQINPGTF